MNDDQIKEAFERVYDRGGYQYGQDNKDNARAWFAAGWRVMEQHMNAELAKLRRLREEQND